MNKCRFFLNFFINCKWWSPSPPKTATLPGWTPIMDLQVEAENQRIEIRRSQIHQATASTTWQHLRKWFQTPLELLGPVLGHGVSLAWSSVAKTYLKHLEAVQNKSLRLITGAPQSVRKQQLQDDLGILSLHHFATTLFQKTVERIGGSENQLITRLSNLDPHRPPVRTAVGRATAITEEFLWSVNSTHYHQLRLGQHDIAANIPGP